MQIIKCFLIFTLLFNSVFAEECRPALIKAIKAHMTENLEGSAGFKDLVEKRAQLALIKSSLNFYMIQNQYHNDPNLDKQLKGMFRAMPPHTIKAQDQMYALYKRMLGLTLPSQVLQKPKDTNPFSPANIAQAIGLSGAAQTEQKPIRQVFVTPPYKPMDTLDMVLQSVNDMDLEASLEARQFESMLQQALVSQSHLIFKDQALTGNESEQRRKEIEEQNALNNKLRMNSVDSFILRNAMMGMTSKDDNDNILDFTLSQMKRHFSQRAYPEQDKTHIEGKTQAYYKDFKKLFAKEIENALPLVMKNLSEECQRNLESDMNNPCFAMGILTEDFDDFEKILLALKEKPVIDEAYLHVAGTSADIKCELELNEETQEYNLILDANLKNFEGITKPIWSLNVGEHNFPIQNQDKLTEMRFNEIINVGKESDIPKQLTFKHTQDITSTPNISFMEEKATATREGNKTSFNMDLTKCVNHPAANPEPKEVVAPAPVETKTETNPPVVKPEETKAEESDFASLDVEAKDKEVKLSIKSPEGQTCGFSSCSPQDSGKPKSKKSCKVSDENEETFKRDMEKGYRVYVFCKEKDSDDYKIAKKKNGKNLWHFIGKCEADACFSSSNDDFKLPVTPPKPPQSQMPNIPIPDMPVLLEG